MIYAGYVKVAPGKPQTEPGKFKNFHEVPGRLNFHWVSEGGKSTGSGFTGSFAERCIVRA